MALRLVPSVGAAYEWSNFFRSKLVAQYKALDVAPPVCVHDVVVIAPMAPYGYRWVPRQRIEPGRIEIVAEHAEVVRKIPHWVSDEGLTVLGGARTTTTTCYFAA